MRYKENIKRRFDRCITEAISKYIADFKRSNYSYHKYLRAVHKVFHDFKIPPAAQEEIERATDALNEIENYYLYGKGLQDGMLIVSYLDGAYIDSFIRDAFIEDE